MRAPTHSAGQAVNLYAFIAGFTLRVLFAIAVGFAALWLSGQLEGIDEDTV